MNNTSHNGNGTHAGQTFVDKTRFLKGVAWSLLAFPILFPLIAWGLLHLKPGYVGELLMDTRFWFISAWSIAAGWGLHKVRTWAWPVFVTNIALVSLLTFFIVFAHSDAEWKSLEFLGALAVALCLLVLVGREIRVPYLNPKILWWENDPRFKIHIPVLVAQGGRRVAGEILDISRKGCFIKTAEEFNTGDDLHLEFTIFQWTLGPRGRVVSVTERSLTRPPGIGVQFIETDPQFASNIRRATKKLNLIQRQYKELRKERKKLSYLERQVRQSEPGDYSPEHIADKGKNKIGDGDGE